MTKVIKQKTVVHEAQSHFLPRVITRIRNNPTKVILFLLLTVFIVLRFINIEGINPFGWDQVDNAWAAKHIIVDHSYPLVGMQAKGNSGVYIGPLYYYFVALFYFFTDLDPIASGIIAGVTGVLSFMLLYYVAKKIFTIPVALGAVAIYTFSSYAILFDRIQWPVNFIMPISLLVLYSLYKILMGYAKYIILLAVSVGLSFHIHFTAIFFPIIIFLTLPFFPRKKETIVYGIVSVFIIGIFILPVLLAQMGSESSSGGVASMIQNYYHGFHLRRVLQLTKDAFIKFESIIPYEYAKFTKFLYLPLFIVSFLYYNIKKERILISYLFLLWFVTPWFVFSTYKGEISDYYFSLSLPLVYIILSYLSVQIFLMKNALAKVLIVFFWLYFSYSNIVMFIVDHEGGSLVHKRKAVAEKIINGDIIKYEYGVSETYLYYLYLRKTKNDTLIRKYYN